MAKVQQQPTFGSDLRDGFKPVNAWVLNGITWLSDIEQFYRERSTIEKEYGAKLSALAKKYHEKKAKKTGSLTVGDTPTLTPGSLESASLTTWTTQLSTIEKRAAEHDRFAGELLYQLAQPLANLATRCEELRKAHCEAAAKLEKERDNAYGQLRRVKGQYDGVCQELESKRKKIENSYDSSKTKANNAYNQQQIEMHNVKNSYLIDINVTNEHKKKYYYEYVPDLLDSMQDLSETRTNQLNSIWTRASQIEEETMTRSSGHMKQLTGEIPRNQPHLDSMMFLHHNVGQWREPANFGFEPSPVWHDDAQMITDESGKTYLRNILGKSKTTRIDLKQDVDMKRREIEKAKVIKRNVREGRDKRDETEIVRGIFYLQEELHDIERKFIIADVEVATITSVVGDISVGAQNHNFKSETFKIPTNCDLCGDRIWGLSAKGFSCRDCGFTCHQKCELKVPPDCPGEQSKEDKKRLKAERQAATNFPAQPNGGSHAHMDGLAELPAMSRHDTQGSTNSGFAVSAGRSISMGSKAPTSHPDEPSSPTTSTLSPPATNAPRRHRVIAPPPSQNVHELLSNGIGNGSSTSLSKAEPRGKMLYPYTADGDGEITVLEGEVVTVIEPDDGSGWMTVKTSHATGVVPASYVEMLPSAAARPSSSHSNSTASLSGSMHGGTLGKKKGPAVAPKRGAKKLQYVEALYDYDARTDSEFSMKEGDRFVLVNRDLGDGWADVEKGGFTKSVPANYIQDV